MGHAELMELVEYMKVEPSGKSARMFQRGVKYRSICARCNNDLLGARYDQELISLTRTIAEDLHKRLFLPLEIETRINRLARRVIGHQLAHGLGMYRRGEVIQLLNEYFVDESRAFPDQLRLYCWLYPYNDQVVTNAAVGFFDFAVHQDPVFFLLQKYYPVGFLITQGELPPTPYDVIRLDHRLTGAIDDRATIACR